MRKLSMNLLSSTFRHYLSIIVAGCLLFTSIVVQAEQLLKTDAFNIHYNAFNSSMLSPDIAKQYGIQRSSSVGVINISVLNNDDNAVTALIEGHAKNAISQLSELKFKKITEGTAIYYLATFNFADKEELTFNLYIVPNGETKNTKLSFLQQFFVE